MLRPALPLTLVALATWASTALAADAEEPIALEYSASNDCPDARAFEGLVRARTNRALFVDTRPARTFSLVLSGAPHPSGQLTVRRGGAVEGERQVRGDTCSDVAGALALMVALAVDPAAALGPLPEQPPPSEATPEARPTVAPDVQAPRQATADTAIVPGPTPPQVRESTPAPPAARRPHTLFLGTDVAISSGVPAGALFGVSPSIGWRSPSTGAIAPSVRLAFLRDGGNVAATTGGAASFTQTIGILEGCLLSWPPGPARLLACGRAEAGVLDAAATDVTGARSTGRGWAALGPSARAEWEALGPLFLEAAAAPMVRLTTDRFYFRPDTTLYRVPVVGLEATAGLGVHFL